MAVSLDLELLVYNCFCNLLSLRDLKSYEYKGPVLCLAPCFLPSVTTHFTLSSGYATNPRLKKREEEEGEGEKEGGLLTGGC